MKSMRNCLGAGVVTVAAIVASCGSSTTITRSQSTLAAALLTESDLPAGYNAVPFTPSNKVQPSNYPACADLLQLFRNDHAPGSLSGAGVGFETGDANPDRYVSESLSSMGTSGRVSALLQRVRTSISRCPTIKMTDPISKMSFELEIAPTDAPAGGTGTVAMTFNFALVGQPRPPQRSGTTQVFTGIGDTILDMGVPTSMDVSGLFARAVQTAQTSLNVK